MGFAITSATKIIGYITKGNGISVHRRNCHNLDYLNNRTVAVEWNKNIEKKYETTIRVHSKIKGNKIVDVIQKLSSVDVNASRFFTINEDEEEIYEIDVYVRNLEHLNKAFNELNKLSFINSVERVMR